MKGLSAIDSMKENKSKKIWDGVVQKKADFDLEDEGVTVNQIKTEKYLLVVAAAASLTLFIFLFEMQISSKNGMAPSLLHSVQIHPIDANR